jgi:hypothetical protein
VNNTLILLYKFCQSEFLYDFVVMHILHDMYAGIAGNISNFQYSLVVDGVSQP